MRGKKAPKRVLIPDAKYGSANVTKLINYVMKEGKRGVATRIVYNALETAAATSKKEPLEVLDKAIENVGPVLEVRGRRIGGANYQIPYEVSRERRLILSYRWMIDAAKKRKGAGMAGRLASELTDACKGEGAAVKKREDTHRMAEANRAFAHFARF